MESSHKELEIHSVTIQKLIDDFRSGLLAIPEFQRDYVWSPSKAPKLLDSLWQKFPIGAVLTWSTEDNVKSRVASRIKSPTQWIIDGQQRTRTLLKISYGEIPLFFDASDGTFKLENAAIKRSKNPYLFMMTDIWGDQYISLLRELSEIAKTEKQLKVLEQNLAMCRDILQIKIPRIHLHGHEITEAIDAFKRINTQGMRLKTTDIEVAQLTVKHSGFVRSYVQPFLDDLKKMGWDRVLLTQLFLACEGLAEKGTRGEIRKRLHDLSSQDLERSWTQIEKGVHAAIQLMEDELGISNMSIFPTGALLMPVAVLMTSPNSKRVKTKDIIDWMILASITKRYSGSSQEKLDKDIAACFDINPIAALKRNIARDSGRSIKGIKVEPRMFNSSLHDRYSIFLTFVACKFNGMKDLFDGRKISAASCEKHHIIPRGSVEPAVRRELDTPANIAFISGMTNRNISKKEASSYLEKIEPQIKMSQCIPETFNFESPRAFMVARAKLLSTRLNEFLKAKEL